MTSSDRRQMKLIILCGVGGVGKTSLSAAMGLSGALCGYKTIVFTIDPARRLADSLGVELSGSRPETIHLPWLRVDEPQLMSALMLNQETVAQELVYRYAGTPDIAKRITQNSLFKLAKRQLTGAEEYLALGKLHQLTTDEDADLVIVDTAPGDHALDFFKGPEHLLKVLEPETMNRIKAPIKRFKKDGKITGYSPGALLGKLVVRVAGTDSVNAFLALTSDLGTMYEAFKQRVHDLSLMLRDPAQTSVFLVTTPDSSALDETMRLLTQLNQLTAPVKGILFNKVTPPLIMTDSQQPRQDLAIAVKPDSASPAETRLQMELSRYLQRYDQIVRHETRMMTQCLLQYPGTLQSYRIPVLSGDIASLRDINTLHPYLTGCIDTLET